jgi:hypothetical protein
VTETRNVTRPKKPNHLATIQYEIDMLNYCYERLLKAEWPDQSSLNLCIEGFLLHYRNLGEFFGNAKELKASEPEVWCPVHKLTAEERASIQDANMNRHNSQISRYLSHCTEIRADTDTTWNHRLMFDEMKPYIDAFRKIFRVEKKRGKSIYAEVFPNHSTASVSDPVDLSPLVWAPPAIKKQTE